jgi:drug/metabolite transporter (DMT)-like permease
MKRVPQGLMAIHAAVALFGLSGLLGKMLAAPPALIVFSRAALAAVALGALVVGTRASLPTSPRTLLFLAGSGGILALHWWTFFQAIQISTVAIGLLSYASFPLFVTFLEPWFFGERLRRGDVLTAVVVVVGLALVTPNYDLHQQLTQGAAWGTLAAFTFAALSLLNRRFVQGSSALAIGAGQNAVAALCLLPFVGSVGWPRTGRDLSLLLVLGLLCTALAHALFIHGLAKVKAQAASVIASLEPVYGLACARLVLGEVPAPRTILGGGLILTATALATVWRASSPRPPPPDSGGT